MKRPLLIAALLLPIVGLSANVGLHEAALADAEDYVIPVSGFDPRDMVRGHYIRYRYDWQTAGDPKWCEDRECRLCLTADPPDGSRIEIRDLPSASCPREIDWRASGLTLYAVRAITGSPGNEGRPPRLDISGTFYVPESQAAELERQLAGNPMAMHVRMTSAGRLVTQKLTAVP